jgi:hypothetical protein
MTNTSSLCHRCTKCKHSVHVWCLGTNVEGGAKTCALCHGGIGPGALVPAPIPPDGWVVSKETPCTVAKKAQERINREGLTAGDGTENRSKTSHGKDGNKHRQMHSKINILSFFQKKKTADDTKRKQCDDSNTGTTVANVSSPQKKLKSANKPSSNEISQSAHAVVDVIEEAKGVVKKLNNLAVTLQRQHDKLSYADASSFLVEKLQLKHKQIPSNMSNKEKCSVLVPHVSESGIKQTVLQYRLCKISMVHIQPNYTPGGMWDLYCCSKLHWH